jgi:hypothetical protein
MCPKAIYVADGDEEKVLEGYTECINIITLQNR